MVRLGIKVRESMGVMPDGRFLLKKVIIWRRSLNIHDALRSFVFPLIRKVFPPTENVGTEPFSKSSRGATSSVSIWWCKWSIFPLRRSNFFRAAMTFSVEGPEPYI